MQRHPRTVRRLLRQRTSCRRGPRAAAAPALGNGSELDRRAEAAVEAVAAGGSGRAVVKLCSELSTTTLIGVSNLIGSLVNIPLGNHSAR